MATTIGLQIWRAIAGPMVHIPAMNSKAYYFPQGHLQEASWSPHSLSPFVVGKPYYLCFVANIQLFADATTDEIFACLTLIPVDADPDYNVDLPMYPYLSDYGYQRMLSFAKILTPSDLNNELPVPESCVGFIFPEFDKSQSKKVEVRMLQFADVHGRVWEFKYIVNRKKKKQILADGWRKFVQRKNLVAGDSVVFMKYPPTEKLHIGIRRVAAFRGKLLPESVKEAIELASRNETFEVVYYPNAGRSDFVVKKGAVDEALDAVWLPGMTVKRAVETEESSTLNWVKGKIYSIKINGLDPWQGSFWRMLQIKWDEPEVLKNYKWVSPWQVVVVIPELQTQEGEGGTPHPELQTQEGDGGTPHPELQAQEGDGGTPHTELQAQEGDGCTPHTELQAQEGDGGTPHPELQTQEGEGEGGTYSNRRLVDRLNIQCESNSTVEEFYLGK